MAFPSICPLNRGFTVLMKNIYSSFSVVIWIMRYIQWFFIVKDTVHFDKWYSWSLLSYTTHKAWVTALQTEKELPFSYRRDLSTPESLPTGFSVHQTKPLKRAALLSFIREVTTGYFTLPAHFNMTFNRQKSTSLVTFLLVRPGFPKDASLHHPFI